MIPILYDVDETIFTKNGLGRLRDCISCKVTEERNGIYECDFEYPVNGQNYDKIQIGRIIAVEHDDTGDVQPFDIVGHEEPINGIVTFHAVHISYRQSKITVSGTNINSLAGAFARLESAATPSNPFTYQTDKTSTGYVGAFDGVPKSVRSILGGVEGSILDAYGGEYEWNRFLVTLHSARGVQRDFAIRYGVNMTDFNDSTDGSGTYSSVIPYWTDGTTTVVGDKQTSGGATPSGRDECIPLDVSEKFESQPTKAQVNAMGLSVLNSGQPYLPAQNITVSFVRLQDTGEFEEFANLLRCGLCDTIRVIFPDYKSSGYFKIVKTVWDVLGERYEEMELGDLSMTLSEALGINTSGATSRGSGEPTTMFGFIQMYAGSIAPAGWLFCQGQAISRTQYADLFSAIGTTYGAGDGSTTFNLPDLRNRFPVGAGSTYNLNSKGGSANAIVPSHKHTFSGNALGTHDHGTGNSTYNRFVIAEDGDAGTIGRRTIKNGTGTSYTNNVHSAGVLYRKGDTQAVSAGTPSGTISTEGTSVTNANLPPYIGINFIIYAGA